METSPPPAPPYLLAQVDPTRRAALHARLRASNTASSPALARLRDSKDDMEVPLHIWALKGSPPSCPSPPPSSVGPEEGVAKAGGKLAEPTLDPASPSDGTTPTTAQPHPATAPQHTTLQHTGERTTPPQPPPSSHDNLLGGLVGHTWASWLHVTYLFVNPSDRGRGIGARLLATAEEMARERGCVASIVQTWDFQAPEFYLRHGYAVTGKVEGYPPGITDFTLVKRFEAKDGVERVVSRTGSINVSDV